MEKPNDIMVPLLLWSRLCFILTVYPQPSGVQPSNMWYTSRNAYGTAQLSKSHMKLSWAVNLPWNTYMCWIISHCPSTWYRVACQLLSLTIQSEMFYYDNKHELSNVKLQRPT